MVSICKSLGHKEKDDERVMCQPLQSSSIILS